MTEAPTVWLTAEPVSMKLSDAISLGATMHGQAFGALCDTHYSCVMSQPISTTVRTCALGAAAVAVNWLERVRMNFGLLEQLFPILGATGWCPQCGCVHNLVTIISHINDEHRWSRERIAEFVATFESAEIPAETEVPAEIPAEVPVETKEPVYA